jgi:hypothetical protein
LTAPPITGAATSQILRRSGFFPTKLVETFEPVMQEESRHILFFVNWVTWHRRNMPWWRRPWFAAKIVAVWLFLIWERIGIARSVGDAPAPDNNFTMTGSQSVGVDIKSVELMDVCLAENDRRLSGYDARLRRPRLMPAMVRFARRFLR